MSKPKKLLDRECIGREATMLCDVTSGGGHEIKVGERVTIDGTWRGTFEIKAKNPARYIRCVPRAWVKVEEGDEG